MSFTNKTVIVTGAGAGIGAAIVEAFAKEGAKVAVVDVNEDDLRLFTEKCVKNGYSVIAILANVAKDKDAQKIIDEVINKFDKIDILVNCAGIIRFGTILNGGLMKSYDELIDVNLRAVMMMTSLAAPHIVKTKGNIVNIASASATYVPATDFTAYCVSKAGVVHFTRAAALELAEHGVRVNCVSPGSTRTDIITKTGRDCDWNAYAASSVLNRVSEPEEIANLVLYLASEKARGITGSNYVSDNGILLK